MSSEKSGLLDFNKVVERDGFPGVVLSTAEHEAERLARLQREEREHLLRIGQEKFTFYATWAIVLSFLLGSALILVGLIGVPDQAKPFVDRLFFVLIGGLAGAKMMARSKEK